MKRATERVGNAAYDMGAYISQVDYWGRAAAAALRVEDLQTLADARVLDAKLALPCGILVPGALGVERHVLHIGRSSGPTPSKGRALIFGVSAPGSIRRSPPRPTPTRA